jgi:type II secretory pathway pseudopilin PulG
MKLRKSASSRLRLWLSTIVFCAFAASLGAQSLLNLDFGAGSRSPKTGFAATGQGSNDFWNLFRLYDPKYTPGAPLVFSGRLGGLKLADGAPTDVSIDVTNAPGVWGNATGDPMYDSYIFAPNGSNIVTAISRLEPGRYNFYLYGHADPDASGEQNSLFKISSAGTNYGPLTTLSSAGWKAAMPWQEGHQFVVFRDVEVQPGVPVVIEIAPGPNGIAVLNGLQISSKGTSPPKVIARGPVKAAVAFTNLVIGEIRYEGNVSDHEARFTADLQIESFTTNEISAPLFQGDVAVIAKTLPEGVRIARSGDQYNLCVGAPGLHHLQLEVVAKITRAEPWNQISFQGPPAAIASIHAQAAGEGVAMQLLSGTALENDKGASQVEGFLNAGREVSLRWQSKAAEVARNALISVETTAGAQVTPAVIKLATTLRYELLQAGVPRLRVALPAGQALTRLQGGQIRDWKIEQEGERQVLAVELIKPAENNYELTLFTEQPLESLPASVRITAPQPLDLERESGALTLSADDTVVDIESVAGLRRVNAAGDALAAFRFSARPFLLTANVKRVEPILTVADRVTARLEESRLLVVHSAALTVEKAGLYAIEFTPQTNFVVAAVTGEGVEDWKVSGGTLRVSFASRVLGSRNLEVQLEQALKTFPAQIALAPLRAAGAAHETAQVGAAAAPGLRVKTTELTGLREIPVAQLPSRTDELLAFTAAQPDWNLTLSTERLPARIGADIFNLITIGDGVVGGSATVRYDLVNQGVQEFHLQVPAHWKNVEFTGVNIRSREPQEGAWTIHLQEKAWTGYTLVVTYDYPFDAANATLDAAGLHAPDAEHETGSVAITTAANLKVQAGTVAEPLRMMDPTELAESDRALVTRPVLLAYRYTGHSYQLKLNAARQQEEPVLDAVADRTQLTSVLTDAGEMLTQASFMVKNNGKQFQRFQLPPGARFWGCNVDGQGSKAGQDKDWLLVPLPEREDRDEAFAVDIVYAQDAGPAPSHWLPRGVALQAPKTDLPNTFAEWELFVPTVCHLSGFGGTMTVARGTTYGLRDALRRFTEFYSTLFEEHGPALLGTTVALLVVLFVVARSRSRIPVTLIQVLVVLLIIGVLASMMLPALSKARTSAQRASAINDLRLIDASMAQFELEKGQVPASLHDIQPYLGRGGEGELPRDPKSGLGYIYVGQGKNHGDPNAILAFSPGDERGRTVLLGGGNIQQMSSAQFEEAQAREASASRGPVFQAWMRGAPQKSTAPNTSADLARTLTARAQAAAAPLAASTQAAAENAPVEWAGVHALSALPTAAGLRSIHIDIPRQGEPFTFTKVLNTGGEPLAIKMSVMNARVFAAMRSAFQLAAFAAGLLLVWWQWRNTRGSLLLTLGAALAIGSVGALLISVRVLHLALIVAAPVLALVLLIVFFRKIWVRPRSLPAPGPIHPDDPGIPPVAAAIALSLLFACSAQAQDSAAANPSEFLRLGFRDGPNPQATITSASYSGVITEHIAQFEGALLLTSYATNQTLPLFGEDVALEDFSVKSGEAKLLREAGKLGLLLPNPGPASVTLKFVVKLGGDVSKRRLDFAIPPALASQLTASIDEPDADVEFPTAVAFQRATADRQTRVEATVGTADRVEIQWTPRTRRAAEVAATIIVDNNALATFANGVMGVRSTLDYQISQGELRQARVRLPAGHRLLRVAGASIRTWQLEEPGLPAQAGGDILVVDLLKGVSPEYKLSLETEKILDAFPATVPLEIPRALDVKRETGLVAACASEDLSLSTDHAADLQRVDAAEFPRPDKGPDLFSVWRFLNPGFSLAIKVETIQPQIEAVVHNNVRIGAEQTALSAVIDYTVKRAGVFAFQAALPAGYTLDSVRGENILQWRARDAGSNQVLEVSFKNRKMGNYSLSLELLRPHRELPSALAVPGVHPLNVRKLSGFISVAAEPGVAAKTARADGLTEIPAASLGAGANSAAGLLAYQFLSAQPGPLPDWQLEIACEKIDSWVRAEIGQVIAVSDNLLNGAALVHYDIQNAPVKEFRLKIPAAYTNVEFNCPGIRRRDQSNEEWRVELQNAVHGPFILVVTWEKPVDLKTNALDLPGVQALGVERESGFVVIHGKTSLQVAEKSSSGELLKMDASQLPDWIGGAEGPLLAYRYVRPGYQLSVQATRFADAAVLQALADQVRLTTVVADDGQAMTEMALELRNNGLQHLEIQLPPGATVWSAYVGGEAVRPARRDGKLLLPLEASGAAEDTPISVELTYIDREKFPAGRGEVNLISPQLGVPLKNARWDLYLPPDYDYKKFAGSMTHQDKAAPAVQSYSLVEYRAQEAEKKETKQTEARAFLSSAREKLANNDVSGINRAGKFRLLSDSDWQSRQEIEGLQKDLERIQGNNLMQQQRVYNYNLSDAAAKTQVANSGDDAVARLQWAKLEQAQELAVAHVRPLRVNLPTRGLRQSFTQVLQTEVEKPLTIRFTAANTRTGGLFRQAFGCVLALAALWAVVKALLPRPPRAPRPA